MLIAFGLASGAAFILAVLAAFAVKKWVYPVSKTALEAYWSARWDAIEERFIAIEKDLLELPRVWEEFARDAKRSQERARWHVRRVKTELEKLGLSDPEMDSIDSNLQPSDADGSGEEGMLALHDAVASDAPPPTEDPITLALRRKWGNQ